MVFPDRSSASPLAQKYVVIADRKIINELYEIVYVTVTAGFQPLTCNHAETWILWSQDKEVIVELYRLAQELEKIEKLEKL
jgi:hypothetical protein